MTLPLFYAAAAATLADVAAFLLLVVPGRAAEVNPLVASMAPTDAVGFRLIFLVLLGCLALLEPYAESRVATVAIRVALAVATVVGLLGALFTVAAAA